MVRFEELPKNKLEVINSILSGSPSFEGGWLKFFPVGSEILFDNTALSPKVAAAGIWTSGSVVLTSPYFYEVVRKDGTTFDIDRYTLSLSGSVVLRGELDKNFSEHHPSGLPSWYP